MPVATRRVELRVLPEPGAHRSRMGRRRALSLVIVHLLVAVHLLLYWYFGSTLTPLEPSEANDTLQTGAVNAGAVFLCVLILSTLVFGRFFCGWACHVVAYQDLARWLLIRVGIRPRPVRSRLLLFVPLFVAYWLYGRPIVELWIGGPEPGVPGLSWHLTTDDFWATFPGPTITALTFLICGFLIVYVMGSKGFCSYGCPYGGLFAIVDRFAGGRIRVNDACDETSACTVNCSSNVDVAAEVNRFGMVVDPGCLKCMDCISVCPNDALYFGFTPRRTEARSGPTDRWRRLGFLLSRETLAAVLLGGLFASTFAAGWAVGTMTAAALTVVTGAWLVARSGSIGAPDDDAPTGCEDLFLASAFVSCFAVFFNLHRAVPLLMAVGLAAIVAWLLLLAVRLTRRRSVTLQRLVLRTVEGVRPMGMLHAGVGLALLASVAYAGVVQWHTREGSDAFRAAEAARAAGDDSMHADAAARAAAHLRQVERLGLFPTRGLGRMTGELARWSGNPSAALEAYDRELAGARRNPELHMLRGLALLEIGRADEAGPLFEQALAGPPSAPRDRFLKLNWELRRLGDEALRLEVLNSGITVAPDDADLAMELCTLLVRTRDPERRDPGRALEVAERATAAGPPHPELLGLKAWLYARAGRVSEAVEAAEASLAAARAAGMNALAADMAGMVENYRGMLPNPPLER